MFTFNYNDFSSSIETIHDNIHLIKNYLKERAITARKNNYINNAITFENDIDIANQILDLLDVIETDN